MAFKSYPLKPSSNTVMGTVSASTAILLCAAFSPALNAQTGPIDELSALSTPADEPLSELDQLSLGGNNPFAEIIIEKQREPVTVTVRALDKITATTIDIEVPMNEVAKFGTLEILPRYCDKRPPEDFPETSAFLEIFDARADAKPNDETSPQQEPTVLATPDHAGGKNVNSNTSPSQYPSIFTGWMFASSPALNALEHAVYDVWIIDCKTQLVETDPLADGDIAGATDLSSEPETTSPIAPPETEPSGEEDGFDLEAVIDTLPDDILPGENSETP